MDDGKKTQGWWNKTEVSACIVTGLNGNTKYCPLVQKVNLTVNPDFKPLAAAEILLTKMNGHGCCRCYRITEIAIFQNG